jgi:hypothetical protein
MADVLLTKRLKVSSLVSREEVVWGKIVISLTVEQKRNS